jgi:hypothetical protein
VHYWIGATADGPFLGLAAAGNCGCNWPVRVPAPLQLGRFSLGARLPLQAVRDGEGQVVLRPADSAQPRVRIRADCGCSGRNI